MTTTSPDGVAALDGLCEQLRHDLDGAAPDLVLAFHTPHHSGDVEELRERLLERLAPRVLLGCPGAGVIGGDAEIESQSGLVLWAASWPDATLHPFRLEVDDGDGDPHLVGWPDAAAPSGVLLLADPFTVPGDAVLSGLRERYPNATVVGGMASGSRGPGEAHLVDAEGVHDEGALGVAIGGAVDVQAVVSQGCRPVGRHLVITAGKDNVIQTLGGKPALEQLRELQAQASETDRALIQTGLHVGRVVDERKSEYGRGDFLVRNILGIDPSSGAIAIGDYIRPGQTIQFMVRDARTAAQEFDELLAEQRERGPVLGTLLFSCNGRGSRFFGEPHHDVLGVRRVLEAPTAGFFAAGEIGPVGGQPFLHGLTASVAVFREA